MDPNISKEEYISMWKNKQIESKPVIKSNYVQIFANNKKLIGHICVICEKIFKGKLGGAQRVHKCDKREILFTYEHKTKARRAAYNLVTTDLMTFNTTRKNGFLEYSKDILQLG